MRTTIVLLTALGMAVAARAQQPLTLEEALREARAANADLPIARYDAQIDQARIGEARGALGPRLALDGDVHGGTPIEYAGSDGRLQIVATQPIYDGGALRAGVAVARADALVSGARYRIAEKDLDLQVRLAYAEYLKLEREGDFRRAGVARLRSYLTSIEARRAAGQGVAGDALKTRVLLGTAEADVADAERRFDLGRVALNHLLGRDPTAELTLAPLQAPTQPPDTLAETWPATPDILQAQAESTAAEAGSALIGAEQRPHLELGINAGAQPAISAFGTGINNGQGRGVEFTLAMNWPLFDLGSYRSRRTQAQLRISRARQTLLAVRRQTKLAWATWRAELVARYREVTVRAQTAVTADDSYLMAEVLYRGGSATALEVVDAYATWIEASEAAAEAELAYRVAEAELIRWSTP